MFITLIKNKIKESRFFDHIIVLGVNQKFAAALMVPDFEHLAAWCKIKNIPYTINKEMISEKAIKDRFKKEIDCFNKQFGATDKIIKFELIDHEWTIDSGEITDNLKLKRSYIQNMHKEQIDSLFA